LIREGCENIRLNREKMLKMNECCCCCIKIDEDETINILLHHYQNIFAHLHQYFPTEVSKNCEESCGQFFGELRRDFRFVGILSNEKKQDIELFLEKVDKKQSGSIYHNLLWQSPHPLEEMTEEVEGNTLGEVCQRKTRRFPRNIASDKSAQGSNFADNVWTLLDDLRMRPEVFFGEKTTTSLQDFLSGFMWGAFALDGVPLDFIEGFQNFLERKYSTDTKDWYKIIKSVCETEEEVFDKFFELIDDFVGR